MRISIVLIWRTKMSDYTVKTDSSSATICMGEKCDFIDGFIDIYTEDEDIKSPFNNVLEAELFATVIVKLLNSLDESKERLNDTK